jgi:hypothetical protein
MPLNTVGEPTPAAARPGADRLMAQAVQLDREQTR